MNKELIKKALMFKLCNIEGEKNLFKEAEKPGLWANIRAKRARGEKPAKPGDEDYPDKKQWNKLTKAAVAAWQRSEGKNPEGGLNAKGRASYKRETGGTLKAPVTESNPKGERAKRQNSFCSRMCGMKRVNTGSEAKSNPDSRINKSLRKWNCKCGAAHETFNQKLGCVIKTARLEPFEPYYSNKPSSSDLLGELIIGDNYIPRPRSGESVMDSMNRSKKTKNSLKAMFHSLRNNPILNLISGGDNAKASAKLQEAIDTPGFRRNFKE